MGHHLRFARALLVRQDSISLIHKADVIIDIANIHKARAIAHALIRTMELEVEHKIL